jgi:hypothetical protein
MPGLARAAPPERYLRLAGLVVVPGVMLDASMAARAVRG